MRSFTEVRSSSASWAIRSWGTSSPGMPVATIRGVRLRRASRCCASRATSAGAQPGYPWGVGVHTGTAFIGTVGRPGGLIELTALGEDVNVAARLASEAAAGEIVCSETAFRSAGLDLAFERRVVTLTGVSELVLVRIIRA